jgi:hypothetical protein
MKPIMKPPSMKKLMIEKMRTMIEPVVTLFLSSELIINAPIRTITPIASPTMPTRKTRLPSLGRKAPKVLPNIPKAAPKMVVKKVIIKALRMIRAAPIKDKAKAATGFSAIFQHFLSQTFISLMGRKIIITDGLF